MEEPNVDLPAAADLPARFAEEAVRFEAWDQGTVMATLPRAWCPSMWATAVAVWSNG
jgi:hypothetical protein